MTAPEAVIIVDEEDLPVGSMEKLAAHRQGALHRAFSIMIGDGRGNLLLQRRQLGKYHCGGLWANSCCGHPRPQENTQQAAKRRLHEELNIHVELACVGFFRYQTEVGNGLVENEYVHLFHGYHQGDISPDPMEVMDLKWVSQDYFKDGGNLDQITPWLRLYAWEMPSFFKL